MSGYQARIDQAMADYDLIEDYFYPLSDEDFENRWVGMLFPGGQPLPSLLFRALYMSMNTFAFSWARGHIEAVRPG